MLATAECPEHMDQVAASLFAWLVENKDVKIVSSLASSPIKVFADRTVELLLVHDAKVFGARREPDDKLYGSSKDLRDRVPRGLTIIEGRRMQISDLVDACSEDPCNLPLDIRSLISALKPATGGSKSEAPAIDGTALIASANSWNQTGDRKPWMWKRGGPPEAPTSWDLLLRPPVAGDARKLVADALLSREIVPLT